MKIKEIAQKAGVSIGTVDRVIHKRGRVSEDTINKVESVIAKDGFKPDPIARQLKLHKKYVVGVLLPMLKSEGGYWSLIYKGIKKAVNELSLFSVDLKLSEFTRAVKTDCIRAANDLNGKNGDKPVDAVIIAPVMIEDMGNFILDLHCKGIKYAFVDSSMPDARPIAIAAQDPYRAGFCAGRIMDLLAPEGSYFISIQMHDHTYNLQERARGFNGYFNCRDKVRVQDAVWSGSMSDTEKFYAFLDDLLKNRPDGVFVTNDAVNKIDDYLVDRKRNRFFKLIGYDLIPENRQGLTNGSVDCIISQCPEKQGYEAVRTLFKKDLLHEETKKEIDIPIEIHFKENI